MQTVEEGMQGAHLGVQSTFGGFGGDIVKKARGDKARIEMHPCLSVNLVAEGSSRNAFFGA